MRSQEQPVLDVLVVCTGNVCRSPMAERMLRAALRRRLGLSADALVRVTSAGTAALVGAPMDPIAAEMLRGHGEDAEGAAGSQLAPEAVEAADLVLTAGRRHRADVIRLVPRATRWTFTLVELARLAPAVVPAALPAGDARTRVLAAVAAAGAARGTVAAARSGLSIPDPIGAGRTVHQRVAGQIAASVEPVADLIALAVRDAQGPQRSGRHILRSAQGAAGAHGADPGMTPAQQLVDQPADDRGEVPA